MVISNLTVVDFNVCYLSDVFFKCIQRLRTGPVALMDQSFELTVFSSNSNCAELPASVLSKIDDAWNWWAKARECARKALSSNSTSSAGLELKKQCQNKISQMFNWASQLDQMKFQRVGDLQQAKTLLQNFAKGLVEIQDLLKGLQAMG